MQGSEIMFQGKTVFLNNTVSYGGAIQAVESQIYIQGKGNFTKNLATVNGGALALAEGSVYILLTQLFLPLLKTLQILLEGRYMLTIIVYTVLNWIPWLYRSSIRGLS